MKTTIAIGIMTIALIALSGCISEIKPKGPSGCYISHNIGCEMEKSGNNYTFTIRNGMDQDFRVKALIINSEPECEHEGKHFIVQRESYNTTTITCKSPVKKGTPMELQWYFEGEDPTFANRIRTNSKIE